MIFPVVLFAAGYLLASSKSKKPDSTRVIESASFGASSGNNYRTLQLPEVGAVIVTHPSGTRAVLRVEKGKFRMGKAVGDDAVLQDIRRDFGIVESGES